MAKNPRYPVISLSDAISRAKSIYEKEHLSTLSPEVAAEAMGYKGINGASLRTIAALRQYGLIEGRGEDVKITKDAQTLIIDDPNGPDYIGALRRAASNPPVFADLRKQFPGSASERNMSVFLEKQGFKPDAAADAAKNFRETMTLVPVESEGYTGGDEGDLPSSGAAMQTQAPEPARPGRLHFVDAVPSSGAPLRVVMNGNRLDIQASVDLEGLKKLKDMLTKFEGILEMMAPASSDATGGGVPFMITGQQKEKLRSLGYSDERISGMTPDNAHSIIASGIKAPPY